MTPDAPQLTVVMPAFNEEGGLTDNVARLAERLRECGVSYEILIVDDGSRDRTGAIADALAGADPCIRALHHPANRGIGGGFLTGVAEARGEWLILIPADLALDLADLGRYFEAARQADVVVGVRSDRRDYSLSRRLVSWINIRLIQHLFGMRERQFQYISLYRTAVLRQMRVDYWRSAFFHAETIIKARDLGCRIVEVEVGYAPRASGRATGARPAFIFRTVRDIFRFWVRWVADRQRRGLSRSHGADA